MNGLRKERRNKFSYKEIVVLECRQNSKIEDDIRYHPEFWFLCMVYGVRCTVDEQTGRVGAKACEGDEKQESPVPPSIEYIRSKDYKGIL